MTLRLRNLIARDPSGTRARVTPAERRVLRSLFGILGETPLASLATVGGGRRVHISTIYFAFSGELDLYFLSHPNALHCRNLAQNDAAAVSVFRSDQVWGGPDHGLQLFGRARSTEDRSTILAEAAYADRFPLFLRWRDFERTRGKKLAARLRTYQFFRFRPDRVKVYDEAVFPRAPFVEGEVGRES
jgi:uncharacterized protein YhbP (UPF0306 family)